MRPLVLPVVVAAALLAFGPAAHAASSKLPQMDFTNPLLLTQIGWMAVILVVLYLVLAYWGLPRIGSTIEARRARISTDLDAAAHARADAERAIAELDAAIRSARAESERTINAAIDAARAEARAEQALVSQRLDAHLARAEASIAEARANAMGALLPIAEEVAEALATRILGHPVDRARLDRAIAMQD